MKKITVTRPFLPEKEEYEKLISRIWKKKWLTNDGPLLHEFQEKIKKYIESKNVILTTNGHLALEIAIRSLGFSSGEVITTPFTFASTTHAITMNGLTPVFCDIDPETLTMNPCCIEKLITEKTKAIVPVHVYGHPCDVNKIEAIAKKHKIEVIYDAAHAFAERYNGRSLASYGYASIYSFHATKLFHSIEGGAIVYRDANKEESIRALRNFGILDETMIKYVGGNAKMNEFQAAMGIVNLNHICEIVEERKYITIRYRDRISSINGIKYFEPDADKCLEYNYAYMPILVDESVFGISRDKLYEELKKENIFTRKYFYPLISDASCYRYLSPADLPHAKKAAESVLCLPIYNGLDLSTVDKICAVIDKKRRV